MSLRPAFSCAALSFAWLLLASACSSDDSSGSTPPGDYAPPGNGVAMGEADACKAITGAEDARRDALSCGPVTRPPCPSYISAGNAPCSQYDQGTVQACVEFIASLSCAELKTRKCIVKVLPGTAPNGCPATPDAETDAGTDAGDDGAVDAGDDAPSDAAEDAESDAAGDAADDAASDAAAD